MKNIAAALVKAQKAFCPALKTNTNPAFKSKYADLSACIEAVVDALNDNGIMVSQRTLECESGVTVETVFLHESGEQFSSGPLHVPASKQDPQGYGSALTYARRYSLMTACGIAPEDDDGNAGTKSAPKAAKLSQKDAAAFLAAIKEAGSVEDLRKAHAAAYKAAHAIGDNTAGAMFDDAKDARKAELVNPEPEDIPY